MSDSDLSSEWAFIPAADKSLEIKVEEKGDETKNILSTDSSTDVTENSGMHKGSCVQDDPLLEPVSHIEDKDFSVQAESTSSSDIDIIDEILEEHPMNISLPSSDLTISSSAALNTNSLPAISEGEDAATEIPKDFQAMKNLASERVEQWVESMTNSCNAMKERFPPWLLRMPDTFDDMVTTFMPSHFFLVLLALVCGIILSQYCFSLDMSETATIAQIKEIVKELKFESRDLKNQMITEIQNEKVFATLEGQIKELKKENFKLSEMLQDVILELQKQTAAPVKKNEVRETESHGIFESEINKLKEQINILQFDNEELQKQLVRIRYGDKSQVDNYAKTDDSKKKETVSNDPENLADDENNSSNVLSEDIVELQKDLHSEVLKLKKWNELFELLTKELDRAAGSKAFKKSKSSEEPKSSKKSDEKKKLFGNWSWKSFQKNLKGTIDNFQKINVSELAAKFVSYKNKQVDGVFTSVGNYFKMAREETRKFFDTHSYNKEKVKNDVPNNKRDIDIWLAELRNKFDEMKLFFKKNLRDFQSFEESDYSKPEFTNSYYEDKSHGAESGTFKKYENRQGHTNKVPHEEEFSTKVPNKKSNVDIKSGTDKFSKDSLDSSESAWMFERASSRAKLRENEEDSAINWYLRRQKDDIEGNTYPDTIYEPEQKQDTHAEDKKTWKIF